MQLYFTHIPVCAPAPAQTELNRFVAEHRVPSVARVLIDDGAASVWAVCVSYMEGAAASAPERAGKVDDREVLSEAEFAVYARCAKASARRPSSVRPTVSARRASRSTALHLSTCGACPRRLGHGQA